MVVRDRASMYKAPAKRILEPRARNAAKLSTPSRMNAPTVSAKAETSSISSLLMLKLQRPDRNVKHSREVQYRIG